MHRLIKVFWSNHFKGFKTEFDAGWNNWDPNGVASFWMNFTTYTIGGSILATTPIGIPQLISKQSGKVIVGKMITSIGAQALFNDGNVNLAAVVGDGFLSYGAGTTLSSAIEVNFNIYNGSISGQSIFNFDKSPELVVKQMTASIMFGAKSRYFSQFVGNSTIGKLAIDFSNQIGNYGLQRSFQE